MIKKLKITESQLKKLVEMYDEPEMQPGKFDNTSQLLHSASERLASALSMKDWYLVKEVFMDISHHREENMSTHGVDNSTDSRESLTQNALDYNMNEEDLTEMGESFNSDKNDDDLKYQIIDLLHELREYFHDRADADGDSEGMYPNEAMQMQTSIDDILSQIDGGNKPIDYSMGDKGPNQMPPPPSEIHINESIQKIKNQFNRFL
jgi:hypothetical protein